jgi:thymidylate kinase
VGKRTYLVEGVSGSGKTSVAVELQRRGHRVVHGDRQLKYVGDPTTGEPLAVPAAFRDDRSRAEWLHRHLCWPVDVVASLVGDGDEGLTFLCGGCRNAAQLLHLFDAVFVLHVDLETLRRRLQERPEDEWAGRGRRAELDLVLRLHRTGQDLPDGIRIDAARPLPAVVDDILGHCEGAPG